MVVTEDYSVSGASNEFQSVVQEIFVEDLVGAANVGGVENLDTIRQCWTRQPQQQPGYIGHGRQ